MFDLPRRTQCSDQLNFERAASSAPSGSIVSGVVPCMILSVRARMVRRIDGTTTGSDLDQPRKLRRTCRLTLSLLVSTDLRQGNPMVPIRHRGSGRNPTRPQLVTVRKEPGYGPNFPLLCDYRAKFLHS